MFARVLELTCKPNKRVEVVGILTNELLPLLKKQTGFVDALGFSSDVDLVHGITIGVWNSKHEAEHFYATPQYKAVMDRIKPLVEKLNIQTFDVVSSTIHTIAATMTA